MSEPRSSAPAGGLTGHSVRSGALLAVGQLSRTALQFAGLTILSRMLTPSDFGIVAMSTAVLGVAFVLGDFGLSLAVSRERDMPKQQRDQLFYFNLLLAAAVAGAMIMCSHGLGVVLGDVRVTPVIQVLSLCGFATTIAAQYRGELSRRLHFAPLAYADPVAQALGLAVSILAAGTGHGYWSIVWGQTTAAFVMLAILFNATRYRPTHRPAVRQALSAARFGSATLLTQLTSYSAVSTGPLVLGRFAGSAAAGVFSRSFQIASMPLTQLAAPLTRVAVPLLARLETPAEVGLAARRMQRLLFFVLIPPLLFLALFSDLTTDVLLGGNWANAASVVSILAAGGIFQTLGYVYFWVFVRLDRVLLLWKMEFSIWAVCLPSVVVVVDRGPVAVATVYASGLALIWLWVGQLGLRRIGVGSSVLLAPAAMYLSWVVLIVVAVLGSRYAFGFPSGSVKGDGVSVVSGLIALAALSLFPAFRSEAGEAYRDIRSGLGKRVIS